ncbi:MAG TPA: hypothetical protein VK752_22505 [Bryobacteraceae bacterium]|jgi:hypothetical protein|nr:hypothetical protein [Bryobacteraceae bacterium]
MATDHILSLLISERDKLTKAIEALQSTATPGPGRGTVRPSVEQDSKPAETAGPKARAKRKLSAAGRRAIIEGTKKRWAAIKAAKSAAEAPAPSVAPTNAAHATLPRAVKRKAAVKSAAFRKKMSDRMKAAWAARKKKAK